MEDLRKKTSEKLIRSVLRKPQFARRVERKKNKVLPRKAKHKKCAA